MTDHKTLVIGAAAAAGAAAAVLAGPVVLSAIGFGSPGVAAGSTAAGLNSAMGGFIAKGSLFSLCQSWGATASLPAAVQAVSAATGAGLGVTAVYVPGAMRPAAEKVGGCLATAGASAAALPSAVWPVAAKTGTWIGNASCSTASAIKAGASAAIGIVAAEPKKPPASRL
uniref:Putative interferon alpha-inducible protein n=1 Tax=Amblyomma triste TaxID=251400 RepID=A0A023G8W4_AMBTT